ncbi:hypothetical protein ACWC09_39930 [Streptomyces sp. NPDC001617]
MRDDGVLEALVDQGFSTLWVSAATLSSSAMKAAASCTDAASTTTAIARPNTSTARPRLRPVPSCRITPRRLRGHPGRRVHALLADVPERAYPRDLKVPARRGTTERPGRDGLAREPRRRPVTTDQSGYRAWEILRTVTHVPDARILVNIRYFRNVDYLRCERG